MSVAQYDDAMHAGEIDVLLKALTAKGADRKAVAAKLAGLVAEAEIDVAFNGLSAWGLVAKLQALAEDNGKNAADGRDGAVQALTALVEMKTRSGAAFEMACVHMLPTLLDKLSDKVRVVQVSAEALITALVSRMSAHALRTLVVPMLLDGMVSAKQWQTKVGALNALQKLAKGTSAQASAAISSCLAEVVPRVSECFYDLKNQVKDAAKACMVDVCTTVGNRDIEPFIPTLISCIERPEELTDCVHKLGATTFVQEVEGPCLAVVVPLLRRGLREGTPAIKRKCAVIVDNMSKLVERCEDAEPFMPHLMPEIERMVEEMADPEIRNVSNRALAGLKKIQDSIVKLRKTVTTVENVDKAVVVQQCRRAADACLPGAGHAMEAATQAALCNYLCAQALSLAGSNTFEATAWNQVMGPYLTSCVKQTEGGKAVFAEKYAEAVQQIVTGRAASSKTGADALEEGEEVCNCQFTLAYGAKILLNMATLRLIRGKRYGLCGPNGAGKSTLMRAIANGQVDGFPSPDQVRTCYVEHDIDGDLTENSVLEYVVQDKKLQAIGVGEKEAREGLLAVGFSEVMLGQPVGSLSGGWKMKLALARAMLMKADILLLDEPTNHLDVHNVAWIENYLISQTNVTSLIVSHDSGFLDKVCTGIVHYEGRKLKTYLGNLAAFVEQYPEGRSYYELKASETAFVQKFKFPEPGFLDGVKSKDKAILKMQNVGFQYPKGDRKILQGVSVFVSLQSRVAILGPNGAGKSTLIKVLTGELECSEGNVWKHPNVRVAYVAQHAFHHLEKHLEKTPFEYIQWRYGIGEDREAMEKPDAIALKEEMAALQAKVHVINGQKLKVEKLIARRKDRRSYEYEVQWQGKAPTPDQTTWLPRDTLEEMGLLKMLMEIDAKEAANAGMWSKPLTQENVAKHLEEMGLDREFTLHSQMKGLSGGQKVKVVLGACMWNNPHILVLDEPTNYLDRDSLAGLAEAIKEFGGGVLLISHHREFLDALCKEKWVMADGKLTLEGEVPTNKEKIEFKLQEEMTDAAGNTIKLKGPKKQLSNKEKKQKERAKKLARELGQEVSDDEDW